MPKKKKNNDAEIVKESYNKNAQLEWERLEGFHFEFEIAKHYLKKYLRGKTVLDIGGGPGRYSVWLAKQGYDVTLVDLSENNIALAKQKVKIIDPKPTRQQFKEFIRGILAKIE